MAGNPKMPTVIKPSPHSGRNRDLEVSSLPQLLRYVSPEDRYCPILRSSISVQHDPASETLPCSISPSRNGFAFTVIRAWQQDLHLRLRPDDVWLAILTQFSFFVNGNAEALRPFFVPHDEGRPKLVVDARPDTIDTVDLGAVAQQLAAIVEERLRDPTVAATLLPSFTTTTPHDRATAAMAFLGDMKDYFCYDGLPGCSFPSVTLLGERRDWADMLRRVAWFGTIGHDETAAWTVRLTKVLEYMVASFDRPDETDIWTFWTRAVHETGSSWSGGIETLSGWVTAFCWWGPNGRRVHNYSDQELLQYRRPGGLGGYRRLTLDGVEFPVIEQKKVPVGWVRVPVTLYQDGKDPKKAALLAGLVGMQAMEEDGETAAQPVSAWWLLSTSERLPRTLTASQARQAKMALGLRKRLPPGRQEEQSETVTDGDADQAE